MKRNVNRRSFILGAGAIVAGAKLRTSAAQGTATTLGQNPVGTAVPVYDETGSETARITILEWVDPFQDWSDYGAPQRGERYVLGNVQIEATGQRPYEFSSYDFKVLDDQGIVYGFGWVSRSDASMVALPDLEDAIMLPGETLTGAVAFNVPEIVPLSQLIYMGYGDSQEFLYLLADLTAGS